MICIKCGCQLNMNERFCKECGAVTELGSSKDNGKIIISRPSKVFAFAINFDVFIDNNHLGTLKNGTVLQADLPFGNHVVKFISTEKDVIKEVELTESQKEIQINVKAKMGLLAARPFITDVIYK